MLFMVLGPLQFVRSLRSNYPASSPVVGPHLSDGKRRVGVTGLTLAFGKTIGGVA